MWKNTGVFYNPLSKEAADIRYKSNTFIPLLEEADFFFSFPRKWLHYWTCGRERCRVKRLILSRSGWRVRFRFYFWTVGQKGANNFYSLWLQFFLWSQVIFSRAPTHLTTDRLKILSPPLTLEKQEASRSQTKQKLCDCCSFTQRTHCHSSTCSRCLCPPWVSAAIEVPGLVRWGSCLK